MSAYFNPTPTTAEEAKSQYRKLIFQFHPYRNPAPDATIITQAINAEYARLLADFAKYGERARQEKAHAEGRKTTADYNDLDAVAEFLRQKIEAALNLGEDLDVELCGLWIWITGKTKEHREEIKAIGGFQYASQKQAWYFAGVKSLSRGGWSLDDIRNFHGDIHFSHKSHSQPQEAEVVEALSA